jgi:hypothetical protein
MGESDCEDEKNTCLTGFAALKKNRITKTGIRGTILSAGSIPEKIPADLRFFNDSGIVARGGDERCR